MEPQLSPMMQQYRAAKEACGEALLLFRMGDFYELFHEDAKIAAKAVGLTLTSRDKGDNPVAMAGFPHHQLDSYLGKLITQGFRVAVCEQMENPKEAKGLVKREVTRVVTPGTLTDDALLDPRCHNFLAAVHLDPGTSRRTAVRYGFAWVDLSTGRFQAMAVEANRLLDELARIQPAECLVSEDDRVLTERLSGDFVLTTRPAWGFHAERALQALRAHFGTWSMDGFGFAEDDLLPFLAAGAITEYLKETQRGSLDHLDTIRPYRPEDRLGIDHVTRRSLELSRTLRDGGREGALLGVLDRTVTPMGARMLADWLASPLIDPVAINARLDAVAELLEFPDLLDEAREQLKAVLDLHRLQARVTTQRASPRDLEGVGKTLAALPRLKARLSGRRAELLRTLEANLELCPELREELAAALVSPCPLSPKDGDLVRPGYRAELDRLRELSRGGKAWIAQYQAGEQQRLGIPSLKVGFNQVFGFYIEVTHAHRDKLPPDYHRKQTLKNAERYITPALKEYEEQVLSADEKSKELEFRIFLELRELVAAAGPSLSRTAEALATLDVLAALADLARSDSYCRPELTTDATLDIRDGRHPVVDARGAPGTFVPNDIVMGLEAGRVLLITGPNMAGKSTYIRQVALITILAQMGSFVPAKSARIGVCDRVLARVGANDELARGLSTFMVEMTETARILNTATARSLVILDEIGRGTSTYDGLSLAWAITEHLHDRVGCRTLFATHYHELTQLSTTLEGLRNLNVAVREWQGDVVFLHKIQPGAADRSYGIHVAKLAGIPRSVQSRAEEILSELEGDNHLRPAQAHRPHVDRNAKYQLTLFEMNDHPLLDEIRAFPLNETPPLEALHRIKLWQESLGPKQPA